MQLRNLAVDAGADEGILAREVALFSDPGAEAGVAAVDSVTPAVWAMLQSL